MPILEDDPEVTLAFEILSGERLLPQNIDRTAHLKHHRAVLRAAMDRAWAKMATRILDRLHSEQQNILPQNATDTQRKTEVFRSD